MIETLYLGVKGLFFSAKCSSRRGRREIHLQRICRCHRASFRGDFRLLCCALPSNLTSRFDRYRFQHSWSHSALVSVSPLSNSSIFMGRIQKSPSVYGAEHKAINAFEAGVTLDVENVKRYSRLHPRCGTSFVFIVVIVSIVLFSIMPTLDMPSD